jgi:two-component system nitrogen regulation sensor histidine kinase NtrY
MVDEFSSFARMPSPIIHSEDLVEITKQATFLMDLSHKGITIETDFPESPIYFDCDARQIGQALTNIIKNASEALQDQEGGKISIKLSEEENAATIVVSDNGKGMPEGMIDRLTEPYVTTRSKGTGLGLAIVKKIMKDHGGNLVLENNTDMGASSTLIFRKNKDVEQNTDVSIVEEDLRAKSNIRIVHGA